MFYNNYQQNQTNINNNIKTQIEKPYNQNSNFNYSNNMNFINNMNYNNFKNFNNNINNNFNYSNNMNFINNMNYNNFNNNFNNNTNNNFNYNNIMNLNNSMNYDIFYYNGIISYSNNSNTNNIKPKPAIKNFQDQDSYYDKENKKELCELIYSPYTYEENIPKGKTIGLNRSKYDFTENMDKLTEKFENYFFVDKNNLGEIISAYNTLQNNVQKFLNLYERTKNRKKIFSEYWSEMSYDGIKKEINSIIKLKSNITKIKNIILKTIPNLHNFKEGIKENTDKIINLCDNDIQNFEKINNSFGCYFKEDYIYKLIKKDYLLINLEKNIIEYIISNVLNLKYKLNNITNYSSYSETSTANYEKDAEEILNREILMEKEDKKLNEEIKKSEEHYKALENDIVKNYNENLNKRKEIKKARLIKNINYHIENNYGELPKNEKEKKKDELFKKMIVGKYKKAEKKQKKIDEQRRINALKFGIYRSKNGEKTEYGGLQDIREKFDDNLTNLINELIKDEYTEKLVKMLNETIKSFIKLKNISEKYVEVAKKLEHKDDILSYYSMQDDISDKEIGSILELKKKIGVIERKISNKMKYSEKFKNLAYILKSYCDEVTSNFGEILSKYDKGNVKNKSEYIDELLETNNTIVDLRKKVINFLIEVSEAYRN